MKYRFLLIMIMALCSMGIVRAQEVKIVNFQRLDRDLMARTQQRNDLNGTPCAILRVSVPNAKEYSFQGNIIGDVIYKTGEAIVYMTEGSRNITISSDKFGSMKYEFDSQLEKQVVYKLTMKLVQNDANKTRTLLMPVAGIGTPMSYGAMIGIVKKWGVYAKVKTNLGSNDYDVESNSQGIDQDGNNVWFAGAEEGYRMSFTGGLMFRMIMPLYLYVGGGYGYKTLRWRTADDKVAKITDKSFAGAEAELGLIWRIKNVALSAGAQTVNFKYVEATVGLGIMF